MTNEAKLTPRMTEALEALRAFGAAGALTSELKRAHANSMRALASRGMVRLESFNDVIIDGPNKGIEFTNTRFYTS